MAYLYVSCTFQCFSVDEKEYSLVDSQFDDSSYTSSDELSEYDNIDSEEAKALLTGVKSDGVARAVQDYDKLVEIAMNRTGCKV